jgi:DNA-binding NarL/FixJ family response regulator
VCRALKVLCAAPDPGRLLALKRATASVHWELVRGALDIDELVMQVDQLRPDVVVIDADLGARAALSVRERMPNARIVSVGGSLEGEDAAAEPGTVKEAIFGLPPPAGPVRS